MTEKTCFYCNRTQNISIFEAYEIGKSVERERIIKLLHEKAAVNWIEALEYPYYADQLEELIREETK